VGLGRAQTGLVLLKTGTGGGFCECANEHLWFHKIQWISWLTEDLLASQEGLCSTELLSQKVDIQKNPVVRQNTEYYGNKVTLVKHRVQWHSLEHHFLLFLRFGRFGHWGHCFCCWYWWWCAKYSALLACDAVLLGSNDIMQYPRRLESLFHLHTLPSVMDMLRTEIFTVNWISFLCRGYCFTADWVVWW
jgi:hypothetical protein